MVFMVFSFNFVINCTESLIVLEFFFGQTTIGTLFD